MLLWLCAARALFAQPVEAQAIPARPFGVASISFTATGGPGGDLGAYFLEDPSGRAFYPVFSAGRLARLLGEIGEAPAGSGARTVLFLFTGTEPFQVTVHTPAPVPVQVRPEMLPARNLERLLTRWWRDYNAAASELTRRGDYPPLLETYLTGMLGQRLGLRTPLLTRLQQGAPTPLQQTLDLLLATESLRIDTMRRTMSGPIADVVADQPIPEDVPWVAARVAEGDGVEIEPMARHVPEECFYVRFGNFENYLWLEDLTTEYGGDIGRMVTARGQDSGQGDRMRRQLATPYTALAKVFGGQLIADVALMGSDLYLQDGPAIGILLQAKNTGALSISQQQQRGTVLAAEKANGITDEKVSIAGRDVSFVSTPDNGVRSFYAIDGDFHLMTTSRRLVERFFAAGQGERCLADSEEFRYARTQMPLSRNDTIFAFFSTAFFRGLLSPQYQIELARRMEAVTDLELVQLARLAAAAEGAPHDSLDELVRGGFLPAGFGRRADGSGPILETRRVLDSRRGARGSFLPVPDVELRGATREEVAWYAGRSAYLAQQWRQLDPVMVGMQRTRLPGEQNERLTVDANVSPMAEEKYGWILSLLGPPVTQRVAPRPGDVVSMQAHVTGGQLSSVIPPHLLFLGVQDTQPALDLNTSGIWQILRIVRTTPGYLGAWPKPGFLDWLPLRGGATPVNGYSRLLFDVWRWQGSDFSVLSFHRDVLDTTVPQLGVVDADQPAQIRIDVGDVSQSRLKDWVTWMYYQRALETSEANVQLLHAMSQQVRVPADQALEVTEELFNTRLVCPLGGKYEPAPGVTGRPAWRSTAWPMGAVSSVPASYQAPLLQWFRGLDVSVTKSGNQLLLHLELDMHREAKKKPAGNSLFDLFKKSDGGEQK